MTISLRLIEEIEKEYGGLYQIAEQLTQRTLPVAAMVKISAALCQQQEEDLLQKPCVDLLAEVLVKILGPLEADLPDAVFMNDMMKKFPDKEKI